MVVPKILGPPNIGPSLTRVSIHNEKVRDGEDRSLRKEDVVNDKVTRGGWCGRWN